MITLGIIILNYRTPQLVVDCLFSLQDQIKIDEQQVIVVDNASGDNSIDIIAEVIKQQRWENWVKLIPSAVNGGFSAGNNVGIKAVEAENYLLLNSDTIVREGAIAQLLNALEKYPEAGILSPSLEWPDGTPQISCFRYHSPISELIQAAATGPVTKIFSPYEVPIPVSDTPFEPQWTSFACVLIRKAVIDQIGLMDEGYFMYFEDTDYCRRARYAGWKIIYYPQARVVHLRGGSGTVKTEIATRKRPRPYLYISRSRYFAKFYGGKWGLLQANVCWLMGRSISLLREITRNRQESHINEKTIQDIWMSWRNPIQPYEEKEKS